MRYSRIVFIVNNLRTAMKSTTKRVTIVLLVFALLVSIALNVLFCCQALKYYCALQLSSLDPTGSKKYAVQNLQLQEPQPGQVRVVLFGDSRIACWNPLPSAGNCQLLNRGIVGETSAQTLLRLERDVISLKPAVVILQVGINDLKTIGVFPKLKDDIINSCRNNITTIVDKMSIHNIQSVILTIFPPGSISLFRRPIWSEEIYRGIEEVNEIINNLDARGAAVVNCDSILASGRNIKAEYARDTFHLTSAGYEALNNSLNPVLEELIQNRLRLEK